MEGAETAAHFDHGPAASGPRRRNVDGTPQGDGATTGLATMRRDGGGASKNSSGTSLCSPPHRPSAGRPYNAEESNSTDDCKGALLGEACGRREYILNSDSLDETLGFAVGLSASAPSASSAGTSEECRLTLMDEIILLGLRDEKGYLSFLNDSISYVLRGCILIELALRRRIKLARPASGTSRSSTPYCDRVVLVVDGEGGRSYGGRAASTGDVLMDEALRLLRREQNTVATWLDILSGETWNPLKIGMQLKQVRERVAKGLVDKGVLRTEKHSFVLFEMATHPLTDRRTKEALIGRTVNTCLGRGTIPSLRSIASVTAALSANVLENALKALPYSERESATSRAEELLRIYADPASVSGTSAPNLPPANEMVAAVLTVFTRLDSLIY